MLILAHWRVWDVHWRVIQWSATLTTFNSLLQGTSIPFFLGACFPVMMILFDKAKHCYEAEHWYSLKQSCGHGQNDIVACFLGWVYRLALLFNHQPWACLKQYYFKQRNGSLNHQENLLKTLDPIENISKAVYQQHVSLKPDWTLDMVTYPSGWLHENSILEGSDW